MANQTVVRVVFLGMNGRFTTTPLRHVARCHTLVGVVEAASRRPPQGLLMGWLRGSRGAGNLRRFSRHYRVPHLRAPGPDSAAPGGPLERFLRRLAPDVLCISNFSYLLPPHILAIPRLGTVNLHLSLLPRFRGPCPWLWMFYHQDPWGGATVHLVDAGEDSGPILGTLHHEVPLGITVGELADQVLPAAGELLARALARLEGGQARPLPQPDRAGHPRAPWVRPGQPLIPWEEWPVERVWHFLRGSSPWYEALPPVPGFVRSYPSFSREDPKGPPGTLCRGRRQSWLACRDGRVYTRLEPVPEELMRLALAAAAAGLAALWAW
jgi:methionyl-tRNA formyltransferase